MKWQEEIGVNPGVCHGKPCIKGTRAIVSVVLANVAVARPSVPHGIIRDSSGDSGGSGGMSVARICVDELPGKPARK